MSEPGPEDYFCVEFSNDPNTTDPANPTYFQRYQDAADFADRKQLSMKAVWLSEYATFETDGGKRKEDWVYFWWSDGSGWGERFGRGEGYPESRMNIRTRYTPMRDRRAT